jgi:Glycosyl transferase family 2
MSPPKTLNVGKPDLFRFSIAESVVSPKGLESIVDENLVLIRVLEVDSFEELSRLVPLCVGLLDRRGELFLITRNGNPNDEDLRNLEVLAHQVGFTSLHSYSGAEAVSFVRGVVAEDQLNQNWYVHRLTFTKRRHGHDPFLSQKRVRAYCAQNYQPTEASYIVPVQNEERMLPSFLTFLENTRNDLAAAREFIFVINGCTDDSERILVEFMEETEQNVSVIRSEPGILPAFKAGVALRTLNGYVGRVDADIILHPNVFDLLETHLALTPDAWVTYAEPITQAAPNSFNQPWHLPSIFSERLYFTGKTSLYRSDPHKWNLNKNRSDRLVADDVFCSFSLVYSFGFDSISRSPHAFVYENVANSEHDLAGQLSRIQSELQRVFEDHPLFFGLHLMMEQDIAQSGYQIEIERAKRSIEYVSHWVRLESTK